MEGEFSPFPEKLRVLVVDDDPVCVKVITQMLKQCSYEVTEVAKATEAVETLRKNPKGFDMVITDTCNDIDVLSLIVRIVKMENIPVILVSGLEDSTTLIKGVLHGADEVISKPVSLAKVKNLWQHVYRRRLNQKEPSPEVGPKNDDSEESAGDGSERKTKKARLRWQGSLQDKFMQAVVQLGGPAKALPKQIMEIMNVPEVSRESVASHLQKYRKQKTPIVVHKNDTNGVLPSSSAAAATKCSSGLIFPAVSTHSCYQSVTPPHFFGGYQSYHNHRHQYSGFNGPMGPHKYRNSTCSSPWVVPNVDPGLGVIPAQPLSMMPPLPTCVPPQPSQVLPIASNNNNFARLPLPPQSQALPPPASMATDYSSNNNSFAFSGKPWVDSGLLDENFSSMNSKLFNHDDELSHMLELHPEKDQWSLGEYQTPGNGAMPIMRDYQQFGDIDGDGAAGSSSQRYS